MALCSRLIVSCSRRGCDPRVGAMSPAVDDGDAARFCEGEERLRRLLGDERQVDPFSREGALIGAAQQQERFGEFDRSGIDVVQAFDERVGVAVRVVASDIEEGLRDRQRRAQLVRGVGGEPLLLGDLGFEPRQHGVEAVGQLAELVVAARQLDPMRERPGRGAACGLGDPPQRSEHAAGENPPAQQAEQQQEEHRPGGRRHERADEVVAIRLVRTGPRSGSRRHVAQEEHPDDGEKQGARDHEEPGVAQGELEPDAEPRRPMHARRRCCRHPLLRRCGSPPRAPWRSPTVRRAVCAGQRQ